MSLKLSSKLLLTGFICLQIYAAGFVSAQTTTDVRVSASIKPLQLIAAAITADVASAPGLIIGPAQDPHHPFLRPSERNTLAEADILLWVGPQLEAALTESIESTSAAAINAYALSEENGLTFEELVDPHVWLSTENARLIAESLTRKLSERDTNNRQLYENNRDEFLNSLDSLDTEINSSLSGLRQNPFAVYHNAFRYYERQYGLKHIASYTENEELQPGIRKVLEVRESLAANDVNCLLLEPANNPEEIAQLTGREMNLVSIDILGFDYAVNKTAYFDFMRGITESIKECLQR